MEKADVFLIGGAMAHTFFRAMGIPIGASRIEAEKVHLAEEYLELAKRRESNFWYRSTALRRTRLKPARNPGIRLFCPDPKESLRAGKRLILARDDRTFQGGDCTGKDRLVERTVGVFEIPDFANGTREIAAALAESGAKTIIGGGDSVTAVNQFGYADKMTFISTGGGASLELLEGKELPGVAALTDK